MKVILASDVESLGHKGDVVTVADGYARNFLVPKGLAMHASKGALKQAEMMQRSRAEKEEKDRAEATARVERFQSAPVYISARAGEDGKLFGSVTNSDIARGIEDQLGEVVDRHNIRLEDPIRTLGTHSVDVDLHAGVHATVNVEVIAHEEEPAV
ncbi:MAG TPA: 50S ribosomal protein L9 [Actinomycetota bacterium]|nr:50S ribosomal protein L9 [Actinomycetota bacterium]